MAGIIAVFSFNHKSPSYGISSRKLSKLLSIKSVTKQLTQELSESETLDFRRKGIGSKLENSPTLVLNADYTPLSHIPLSLWSWQDSLRAVFSDKAVVVSEYKIEIRSPSCAFKLPSVIALKNYHKKPNNVPVMTRRYVFIRDGFCCQYCQARFPMSKLSLDHVTPRSKGGKLVWTNTVTACMDCNYKKGNTHPNDLPKLGMRLKSEPYAPTFQELQFKGRALKKFDYHPDWTNFL